MSGTTSALTAAATTGSNPAAAATRLGGDLNTFLTMLTTQLQNQDPTNPLDTNQMTNQLVQFASVEQQIAMNQNLTSLIGLQQSAQLTAAAPMIGRQIEVTSDQVALQDGRAEIRLPAAGAARYADIIIAGLNGQVLRQQTVALGADASGWSWDGRNASGVRLPDGAYRVAVSGRDANGAAVALSHTVRGTMTGAQRGDAGLTLNMGPVSLGFDALRSILPES